MTQEEKELLLKDIFGRIPYGVKCSYLDIEFNNTTHGNLESFEYDDDNDIIFVIDGIGIYSEHVKPYLFPLSSMTDELWDKEFRGYGITEFTRDSFKYGCETLEFNNSSPDLSSMVRFINQLIKNHFDIYGLIPMGLALDATGLNIY